MSSQTFIGIFVSTLIFVIASLAVICRSLPLRSNDEEQQGQQLQLSSKVVTSERDEILADREKLNRTCIDESGINQCQGQKDEYVSARNLAKSILLQHAVLGNSIAQSEAEAEQTIEKHLEKVQELKRAWYRLQGLEHIEPADDGLWQGDVILSEEQADFIIKQIEESSNLSPDDRQKRAASIFFEKNPSKRWDMPIHFWISSMLSESHKDIIRSALSNITAAVHCIEFYEDSTELTSGSQIQYHYAEMGCGGFSSATGRRLAAQQHIHLGACSTARNAKAAALHETIHALGGGHEQSRVDRDEYIKIIWNNIDPQKLYNYAIDRGTSTYGVRYDYNSIMHYRDGDFALRPGLGTMIPLHDNNGVPVGGLQELTEGDVLQLERMYCLPETCADVLLECGVWATDGWCENEQTSDRMKTHCRRSCSFCEYSE